MKTMMYWLLACAVAFVGTLVFQDTLMPMTDHLTGLQGLFLVSICIVSLTSLNFLFGRQTLLGITAGLSAITLSSIAALYGVGTTMYILTAMALLLLIGMFKYSKQEGDVATDDITWRDLVGYVLIIGFAYMFGHAYVGGQSADVQYNIGYFSLLLGLAGYYITLLAVLFANKPFFKMSLLLLLSVLSLSVFPLTSPLGVSVAEISLSIFVPAYLSVAIVLMAVIARKKMPN